ncbi:hypothetical protein BDZ91DRAFT_718417, partial [Kalaharituber pfeilii]
MKPPTPCPNARRCRPSSRTLPQLHPHSSQAPVAHACIVIVSLRNPCFVPNPNASQPTVAASRARRIQKHKHAD